MSLLEVLLKFSDFFVILPRLFVIRNLRGTSSPAELLDGVHGQRKVGRPALASENIFP